MATTAEIKKALKEKITTSSSNSVLAALFRVVVKDLNISNRVEDLIFRASARVGERQTEHSIGIKVKSDTMTIKHFLFLLDKILHVKSFRFTIELTHQNNKVTVHSLQEINFKKGKDDKKDSSETTK